MANLPIRNLGKIGIVTDANPFDLPPEAFTRGSNVRFDNGTVRRSPIFRSVVSGLTEDTTTHMTSLKPTSGFDIVFTAGRNGKLYKHEGGSEVDVTPPAFQTILDDRPFTSCVLGEVLYMNRVTDVPQYYDSVTSRFQYLPNWDTDWQCGVLRSFKDFLIALNITKSGTEYPNVVKWSDATLSGAPPTSWDHTNPQVLAGEATLAEFDSHIVDGLPLGNSFLIYGTNHVWRMEFTPGIQVFAFRKIFGDAGAINANCVHEIDSKHYVFGPSDIYITDGITWRSITEQRVHDFIYNNMNVSRSGSFFVAHDEWLNEVHFCYVSGDSDVIMSATTYCNKVATYNYRTDTWSFGDLPNVSGWTYANANSLETWITVDPEIWSDYGGSWYDQEDSFERHLMFLSSKDVGNGLTSAKILGYDKIDSGRLSFAVDTESNFPAYVERVGIDLDEAGAPLRGYKVLKSLSPQATLADPAASLTFTFGSSLYSDPDGVSWGTPIAFNPSTMHKIDFKQHGRYLAYRLDQATPNDFAFGGFDADLVVTGRR